MEGVVILGIILYTVGFVLTYMWCVRDLVEGAAVFCALFSWIALFFIGMGELAYWSAERDRKKKRQSIDEYYYKKKKEE